MKIASTSEYRADVLRRLSSSGLSVAAFCQREKLPYSTISAWRRRATGIQAAASPNPEFVEIECLASSRAVQSADSRQIRPLPWPQATSPQESTARSAPVLSAELELPGGVVLRLFARPDASAAPLHLNAGGQS